MAIGLRCNKCEHIFLNLLNGSPYTCPACGDSSATSGCYPLTDRANNIISPATIERLKSLGILPENSFSLANSPEVDSIFEPRQKD